MSTRRIVRAAGGVITRHDRRGQLEVLLVHRPHNQDWTFPKGKVEPGETDEACAAREVEEETGLRCRLGRELPHTSYTAKGRPKRVRYWLMHPEEGLVAEPRNEVDAVRWVPLAEALRTLTYERDRALLDGFRASLGGAGRREPRDAETGGPT
jgi:8-oxo-dGTP pyrophosphatase MutT (NUDIX family)